MLRFRVCFTIQEVLTELEKLFVFRIKCCNSKYKFVFRRFRIVRTLNDSMTDLREFMKAGGNVFKTRTANINHRIVQQTIRQVKNTKNSQHFVECLVKISSYSG